MQFNFWTLRDHDQCFFIWNFCVDLCWPKSVLQSALLGASRLVFSRSMMALARCCWGNEIFWGCWNIFLVGWNIFLVWWNIFLSVVVCGLCLLSQISLCQQLQFENYFPFQWLVSWPTWTATLYSVLGAHPQSAEIVFNEIFSWLFYEGFFFLSAFKAEMALTDPNKTLAVTVMFRGLSFSLWNAGSDCRCCCCLCLCCCLVLLFLSSYSVLLLLLLGRLLLLLL